MVWKLSRRDRTSGSEPRTPRTAADPVAELIEAIDEPLLLLDTMIIARANAAARNLLGQHIVGEYARLILRSPAASPLLSGDEDGPVTLTGLGGHDRLWELAARTIAPDRRLLRLTDRSATRAAERMRVDFVANASHELRTPLAALIGFIETLEDANGPDDAATRLRFLAIMAGEARRMQRLIDDLMSLSRIEADRYARPRDAVDLAEVAREVCADLTAAGESRVECTLPEAPAIIDGDRSQISQLIHNIVGNALKYGRTEMPVTLAVSANAETVRLSVTDHGEGIAAQHLPRLTERFYRVDPGRSRAAGGTGLGLAIVKHIVERHRGILDIASTVGEGTTVTIDLPPAGQSLS